jgi:hypothetical protein
MGSRKSSSLGSSSLDRRVQAYLPPKYHQLFTSLTQTNEMGESEMVNVIVREYFDKMPDHERQRLLLKRHSKNSY